MSQVSFETKNRYELFPSTVFEYQLDNFETLRQQLIDAIHHERNQNKGVVISNYGGWQSNKDFFIQNDPAIQEFRQVLTRVASDFLKQLYHIDSKPDDFDFDIWANVNSKGHTNLSHDHTANSNHWSGVIYIKTMDDESVRGNTIFEDKHFSSSGIVTNRLPIVKGRGPFEQEIVPKQGKMMFFPGTLWHRVGQYMGADERITIAYNFRHKQLELFDFDTAQKSTAFKTFMWYNFRGVMRGASYFKRKLFR